MIYETITLSEKWNATLTSYCTDISAEINHSPRKALIVCPGGAYEFLSDREGEPIVRAFSSDDINVFLLRYSVGETAGDFAPLIQVSLAIKYIRENAARYNIDERYVYVIGFSAGGHLAASSATLWKHPRVLSALGDAPYGINRPTGVILSYPVISSYEFAEPHSIWRVTGGSEDPDVKRTFSLEYQVDDESSPAFIWCTMNDGAVPSENSLLFANALKKFNVPFELHIFPDGVHGLATCREETCVGNKNYINPHVGCWTELAAKWIHDFDYGPLYDKVREAAQK